MKLVYCTHSVCNPGGMERVLINKVTYLVERLHWDVSIVTTDQKNRPAFYSLPSGVKMTDLEINYSDDNVKSPIGKIVGYLKRRRKHRRLLTDLLKREKADIVVSLYPSESSFIPSIKDGSKKVLELHYNKFFRLQYNRKGLLPNAALFLGKTYSDVSRKRIIAVGRLDYQKGFDRLIQAWELVQQNKAFKEWHLDVFGQGEWRDMLQKMINERGLQVNMHIHPPTKNIGKEYAQSSLLVMSSNYEGFPMVMIEAMASGLPVVSFDYKCGPKDIIRHRENGLLVDNGDIQGLADAMMEVMGDDAFRKTLSENARKVVSTYSEEAVMRKWISLFHSLVEK